MSKSSSADAENINRPLQRKANSEPESGDMGSYSISKTASSLNPQRSPSWVKQQRKTLVEIFYWCPDRIQNPDGTFTQWGFEQMQELLNYTGKLGSDKAPLMDVQTYAELVWKKHGVANQELDAIKSQKSTEVITAEVVEPRTSIVLHRFVDETREIVAIEEAEVLEANLKALRSNLFKANSGLKGAIRGLGDDVERAVANEIYVRTLSGAARGHAQAHEELSKLKVGSTAPLEEAERRKEFG